MSTTYLGESAVLELFQEMSIADTVTGLCYEFQRKFYRKPDKVFIHMKLRTAFMQEMRSRRASTIPLLSSQIVWFYTARDVALTDCILVSCSDVAPLSCNVSL
jgi:hypothetical protein